MTRARARKEPQSSAEAFSLKVIELKLWAMEHHMCRLIGHCARLMREKETLRIENRALLEEMELLRDDVNAAHRYIAKLGQRRAAPRVEAA
jgi:branched-subunit amino acid aminotransferase/4-amino-4-deoxychorismate lyase